jgi:hypothetical protein
MLFSCESQFHYRGAGQILMMGDKDTVFSSIQDQFSLRGTCVLMLSTWKHFITLRINLHNNSPNLLFVKYIFIKQHLCAAF